MLILSFHNRESHDGTIVGVKHDHANDFRTSLSMLQGEREIVL